MNFFSRLKEGLTKTRSQIASIVGIKQDFDDQFYEALEEALIAADIGVNLSLDIIERLKQEIKMRGLTTPAEAYATLKSLLIADLTLPPSPSSIASTRLVLLISPSK